MSVHTILVFFCLFVPSLLLHIKFISTVFHLNFELIGFWILSLSICVCVYVFFIHLISKSFMLGHRVSPGASCLGGMGREKEALDALMSDLSAMAPLHPGTLENCPMKRHCCWWKKSQGQPPGMYKTPVNYMIRKLLPTSTGAKFLPSTVLWILEDENSFWIWTFW